MEIVKRVSLTLEFSDLDDHKRFLSLITGNDDDIVLAAEKAIVAMIEEDYEKNPPRESDGELADPPAFGTYGVVWLSPETG